MHEVTAEDAREHLELLCSAATVVAGICRLVGVGPSTASGDEVSRGASPPPRLACFDGARDGAFILPEEV